MIHYHNWVEICQASLKDANETKDWVWNFEPNNDVISSVINTDGCKEYCDRVKQKEQETGEQWRLLCSDFFLDGYMQQKSRGKTVTGIYMRITNKVIL